MKDSPCCKFRPCIDLHDGFVKQIVGSTLSDKSSADPLTNYASNDLNDAKRFAEMYKRDGLFGGHVIMLGAKPENSQSAIQALKAFPGGLQVGGGINSENAKLYIDAGASQVIVTSFVFRNGVVDFDRLKELVQIVGKDRLVLDLSCRSKPDDPTKYFVVTDRWQKFTDVEVTKENLSKLAEFCCEFLVHGVDVEGKRVGIISDLVKKLGEWSPIPVTYAGGVRSLDDVKLVKEVGQDKVDVTVGSALDIFGGDLAYTDVVTWHKSQIDSSKTIN